MKARILQYLLFTATLCMGCSERWNDAPPTSEGFDITGAWTLLSHTYSDGRVIWANLNRYTRCKIYDVDSSYYCIQLRSFGDNIFIDPHEQGFYSLHDTLYIENGRVTPFHVIDDSTMTTTWGNIIETWRRSTTMSESRKEEIRNIFRYHQKNATAEDPLQSYVLSITENKLRHTINIYHYLFVALLIVIFIIVIYAVELAKRKRSAEQNLIAIKEELNLRPTLVTNAIKQVEYDFFQSDYYQTLRPRLAAGENLTDEDWREMEHKLNTVYTGFSRKLRSLYDFSNVEFQVCMLIKLGVANNDIAAVINRAPNSVSSIRARLYKKVLGANGGAKEWDDFVLSL